MFVVIEVVYNTYCTLYGMSLFVVDRWCSRSW